MFQNDNLNQSKDDSMFVDRVECHSFARPRTRSFTRNKFEKINKLLHSQEIASNVLVNIAQLIQFDELSNSYHNCLKIHVSSSLINNMYKILTKELYKNFSYEIIVIFFVRILLVLHITKISDILFDLKSKSRFGIF